MKALPLGATGMIWQDVLHDPLLARQAKLNAALDLDKNERQIAPAVVEDTEPEGDIGGQRVPPPLPRNSPSPAIGL
jgi:hypothetical protein